MASKNPILIVDDDPQVIDLIARELKGAQVPNPICVFKSGREAMGYLSGLGIFHDRSKYLLPELIFLDWKMPDVPGRDLLLGIRSQPRFSGIRILVLSNSQQAEDMKEAYGCGADFYLVKPLISYNIPKLIEIFSGWPDIEKIDPSGFLAKPDRAPPLLGLGEELSSP